MDISAKALEKHKEWNGKIEVVSRVPINSKEDLSLAYTPGVATPCLEIEKNPELSYTYTRRNNMVAVITDGTAVLGLGDIGPLAAMPVMEGKCALFKEFADVDAFPLCVDSKDTDELVRTIYLISKSFGGINLEDISAPRCFEVEAKLKEICDIPVFHDDQHGTAIVALAALINALKVVGKKKEDVKIIINGAGSAGISIAKLLIQVSFGNIILVDRFGAISKDNPNMNKAQSDMAKLTNKDCENGDLSDVIKGADVFIGVSAPGVLSQDMVSSMNTDAIVFAMANPVPEIMPDLAKQAGAKIVGTGRSDFPNQINNVLAFPGIFKGALKARAKTITEEMKIAAAFAIASGVSEEELSCDHIIPNPLDKKVADKVALAVIECVEKER